MSNFRTFFMLATVAALGTGCAHFGQGSAAGSVIDPAEASKTVVLHVDNVNPVSMELRAIVGGRSQFVGSVAGSDTTTVLLDPSWFPTATLYVLAIPADGRGRAVGGPLAAGKGDRVIFTVQPALDMSLAVVRR
jgi:hypothetical protein